MNDPAHSMYVMPSFGFAQKPTVLLVDHSPDNIALLSALLKEQCKLKIATNGLKALQIAAVNSRLTLFCRTS